MDETNTFFKKDQDAFYKNTDGRVMCYSVHGKSLHRFDKARLEAKKEIVPILEIINHVNNLFSMIGIKKVENPIMDPKKINYAVIKKDYQLEDEKDIIWMKFTKDGYLGVIAQSNDINFDIPSNPNEYNKKTEGHWKYNTSGILIHKLKKEWEESFVLVFPLHKINTKYNRYEIETAVGNYLIHMRVPLLDYFSHNY